MTAAHFQKLLTYDKWAYELMLQAILAYEIQDDKIKYWMSHILNAGQIWLDRIQGNIPLVSPHQMREYSECAVLAERLHTAYIEILDKLEPASTIDYQTTTGRQYFNEVQDILTHVINHGTHHRAQVAAQIRNLGFTPPASDFIFYLRRQ